MHLRIQGFDSTRQFVIFNGLSLDAYQSVSPQGQHSISLLNEPRRNVLILSLFIETLFTCLQSSWDSLYACLLQGFHGYDPMCQHSSDCRNHSNGSFWNVSQEYEQSVYRSEVFLILLLRCVVLFDFFILPFQNIGFLAVWNQSAFNHCRTCCTMNHIINAAFCFTVACSITSAIVC